MGGPDVGDDSNRGRADVLKEVDLTGMIHAHLKNQGVCIGGSGEQRKRHADVVVEVALGLMNSRHLIANGQGHSVMGIPCLREAMTDFIVAGTVSAIDDSCLETIQAAPFFETLTGPAP